MAYTESFSIGTNPDFQLEIEENLSNDLERAAREETGLINNVAWVLSTDKGVDNTYFQRYWGRLQEAHLKYQKEKAKVSTLVMDMVNEKHPDQQVSVDWSYDFHSKYVDIAYTNKDIDHDSGLEKTLLEFDIAEIGFSDEEVKDFIEHITVSDCYEAVTNLVLSNFGKTMNDAIDGFFKAAGDSKFEYDLYRTRITNFINDKLTEANIEGSCKWTFDDGAMKVFVTRQYGA